MVTNDIISVKNNILQTVGSACEKIYLFGSHAYGTPRPDSDYDFFVVLQDGTEKPILVLEKIYQHLCDTKHVPVDILANYKSRFEERSKLPAMERKIANEGVLLYERS
jgi:predicted nucleotidyltransferase